MRDRAGGHYSRPICAVGQTGGMGVKSGFGSLSDDDVRQITELVESLDRSGFDFLQLGVADMTLTLSKGALPTAQFGAVAAPVVASVTPAPAPTGLPTPPLAVPARPNSGAKAAASPSPAQAPASRGKTAPQPGTIEITAPLTGLFYSKPDPASPPFVTVGATVGADATVCLIEVMKVFNAVPAGIAGVITEICAQDAEMIEIGQVLFRVRPAGAEA
jgi:acetyl-CoA carboxylase biotin carboxyl carrier protein